MPEPREMYRISKMHRKSKAWQRHGGKYTQDDANRIKRELEHKGWVVTVYRA